MQTRTLRKIRYYPPFKQLHTYLAKRAEGSLADLAGTNTAVAMLGLVLLEFLKAVCTKEKEK